MTTRSKTTATNADPVAFIAKIKGDAKRHDVDRTVLRRLIAKSVAGARKRQAPV